MMLCMLSGDSFKTMYFIMRSAPPQVGNPRLRCACGLGFDTKRRLAVRTLVFRRRLSLSLTQPAPSHSVLCAVCAVRNDPSVGGRDHPVASVVLHWAANASSPAARIPPNITRSQRCDDAPETCRTALRKPPPCQCGAAPSTSSQNCVGTPAMPAGSPSIFLFVAIGLSIYDSRVRQ
jgi:hypothetical protein